MAAKRKMSSLKAPGVRRKATPAKKATPKKKAPSNGGWSITGRDKKYGMIGTGGSPFTKKKR